MARLVARALRLGRSALIQVGAVCGYQGRYRTSFVASALMWHSGVVIVAPEVVQQRLLKIEIPRLLSWLQVDKPIRTGNAWVGGDFQGILLTTPEVWLNAQLTSNGAFTEIPTIIDGVDDLENWVRASLTITLSPSCWDELAFAYPKADNAIRTAKVELTHNLFKHPANPYECYVMDDPEIEILQRLYSLELQSLPDAWNKFYSLFQMYQSSTPPLLWATINRTHGTFSLHACPVELAPILAPIWQRQPVVLVGSALETETEAPLFRSRMGLREVTCLKFAPDNQSDAIQLYVPYNLPLPNTPEYQAAFIHKARTLVCLSATAPGLTVILVGDVPLKAQVGTILASEFGSRVQVEKTCLDENGILVTGWEFWRTHQSVLPSPRLMIIATLPLPSLENPLVSLRVAHYKRTHQDWFRLYLLPTALNELQRAIAPVRENQGVVALLDSRVVNRSYGAQILNSLSPLARINYLDPNLFKGMNDD
jgi:ATP-dependent DNA helicase DinG